MAARIFTDRYTDGGRRPQPAGQGTWIFEDAALGRHVRQGDYAEVVRAFAPTFLWLLPESFRYDG